MKERCHVCGFEIRAGTKDALEQKMDAHMQYKHGAD